METRTIDEALSLYSARYGERRRNNCVPGAGAIAGDVNGVPPCVLR